MLGLYERECQYLSNGGTLDLQAYLNLEILAFKIWPFWGKTQKMDTSRACFFKNSQNHVRVSPCPKFLFLGSIGLGSKTLAALAS